MNFIDLCKCYVRDVPVGNKRCYVRINYDEKKKKKQQTKKKRLDNCFPGITDSQSVFGGFYKYTESRLQYVG